MTANSERSAKRDEAKRIIARAFDRSVRACAYSNDYVAMLLDVGSTRVRRQRSDDGADLDIIPTVVDLLLADHALAERFMQEIRAERLAMHGEAPAVTVEQQTHRAVGAVAAFVGKASAALENGVIENHEVPGVEDARVKAQTEFDALGAMFKGRTGIIR